MELKEYFNNTKGFGVMSTADSHGKVNSAVFARPHFMEDGTLAFIMRDRLTYQNILQNGHASYLFREDSPGYKGRRLFLTRVRVEEDPEKINSLSRRREKYEEDAAEPKFLVHFKLDGVRPLIGPGT
jgi:hypothetical protein